MGNILVASRRVPKRARLLLVYNKRLNEILIPNLKRIPKERRVLLVYEPPTVHTGSHLHECLGLFGRVYTYNDELVDGRKYFKFHIASPFRKVEWVPFDQRKLCTMVVGNKSSSHPRELYSKRRKLIDFFEGKEGFEFYGRGWEKWVYKNYRGACKDKLAAMRNYKFSICYENCYGETGYITEKIFDAFLAGSVPIYLGAPNITDYVPGDCFIDRESFESDEEMVDHLKSISKEEHSGYLGKIKNFLKNDANIKFFSQGAGEQLAKSISKYLQELLPRK